jgi:hypothetical protein
MMQQRCVLKRNCLGAAPMFVPLLRIRGGKSSHHFQDPELLIDVAIMDWQGGNYSRAVHAEGIFKAYNPETRFDIICGCNEYDESEGLFPNSLLRPLKRTCEQYVTERKTFTKVTYCYPFKNGHPP